GGVRGHRRGRGRRPQQAGARRLPEGGRGARDRGRRVPCRRGFGGRDRRRAGCRVRGPGRSGGQLRRLGPVRRPSRDRLPRPADPATGRGAGAGLWFRHARRAVKLPAEVTVYEVGPRDGLQNEARNVPTADKIRFIDALVASGIRSIEITSFVSPKWIPQLADAAEVARGVHRPPGVRMSALVPNRRGLDTALASGMKEVAVFLSASETHNKKNVT